MTAEGLGPVDVFGSSGGAVNGLAWVTRHPSDIHILVAHEPPILSVLPDAANAFAAERAVQDRYHADAWSTGMAAFIAMTMVQGGFTDEFLAQPHPDPAAFGMPTEDDGNRDDPTPVGRRQRRHRLRAGRPRHRRGAHAGGARRRDRVQGHDHLADHRRDSRPAGRDGWILISAHAPEHARQWIANKREALTFPEYVEFTRRFDEAHDWDADDPRLAVLADDMTAALGSLSEEEQALGLDVCRQAVAAPGHHPVVVPGERTS